MPPPLRASHGPPKQKMNWRGITICKRENRISFDSTEAANKYFKKYCPRHTIEKEWTCDYCGHIHRIGVGPSPSGERSRTTTGRRK